MSNTPLLKAIRNNDNAAVKRLLQQGAPVNEMDETGDSPVMAAARRDNIEALHMLVDHGADLELKLWRDQTVRDWAMANDNALVLDFLREAIRGDVVRKQAAVKEFAQRQKFKIRALGRRALVRKFTPAVSQPTLPAARQLTLFDGPMEDVLERRDTPAILTMLKQGADMRQTDHNQNTPLMLSVFKNDPALMRWLVENKADLETRNVQGKNALDLAIMRQKEELVGLLLDAGARITQENITFAKNSYYKDIEQMLYDAIDKREARSVEEKEIAREKDRHNMVVSKQKVLKKKAGQHRIKIPA